MSGNSSYALLILLLLLVNLGLAAWLLSLRRRSGKAGCDHDHSGGSSHDCAADAAADSADDCAADAAADSADDCAARDTSGAGARDGGVGDCAVSTVTIPNWERPEGPFLVPPMVQIGADADRLDAVELVFYAPAELHGFTVKAFSIRQLDVSDLKETAICLEGIPPHRRYCAVISGLTPGETFTYWVIHGGKVVFESQARARKPRGENHRFVVVGDMGNGSVESSRVAHRIYQNFRPDLLGITGDVVYMNGRVSEYLRRFLPVYNARVTEPNVGSPILSQVLAFTSAGNHCVGKIEYYLSPSFDQYPDLHAFFLYWSLPLNGPIKDAGLPSNIAELNGDPERVQRFLKAAGERFPSMTNYYFDYGDARWLVLDANSYMDWTNERLRGWVEASLRNTSAKWKFVNFHQPGFTSNPKHGVEKRMRHLAAIFESCGVDIVFNGHAHYYERSYPLSFKVVPRADGNAVSGAGKAVREGGEAADDAAVSPGGIASDEGRYDVGSAAPGNSTAVGESGNAENEFVGGELTIDTAFDGDKVTRPNGVIYIVSGAGGAKLDPSGIQWRKDEWQPFTHKLIGDRHSFTVCDVDGGTLTLRQIDMYGREMDRLVITK